MTATGERTTKIGPTFFLEGRYEETCEIKKSKDLISHTFSKPEGHRITVSRAYYRKIDKASTALEVVSVSKKRFIYRWRGFP